MIQCGYNRPSRVFVSWEREKATSFTKAGGLLSKHTWMLTEKENSNPLK